MTRYETRPKRVMKPPRVAHTMLKLTIERVGMAIVRILVQGYAPSGWVVNDGEGAEGLHRGFEAAQKARRARIGNVVLV